MTEAIQRTLKPLSSPGKLRRPSTVASQQSETKRGKSREPETDTTVVEAYLKSERPVHCRRTLDQYCYYMLDTTETRDRDQVVYKWARKQHQRASRDIDTGSSDARETHHWPLKSEVLDGTTIPGGMEDDHEHFKAKLRPIIMVDQLWLWILPDGLSHFVTMAGTCLGYACTYVLTRMSRDCSI
ncbi:hypothetical protein B0T26DRAFT_654471 [Lasiosphaeria miniovina]|uniref:Uncharacterized protein n=1 Tax=Lasiosphaeria miniovina TaxID=1954250 RepID=A0AA40A6Q0_9PEZI|nr:uncharacterized protein B0T26DRAFT_654471 [Lasiosphaeria miniovina]KAK0710321.1 hypothetical protein B0T26DRAFT_654471 [Lasiosphaeria miniovina]